MLRKLSKKNLFVVFLVFTILIFSSLTTVSAALTDNLISYYKLDETSGTNALDSHGNYDGTANNARVFTSEAAGIINTGVDFTQGNDWIDMGDSIDFGTSDITISVWIKTSYTGDQQDIVSKMGPDPRYYFDVLENGDMRFLIDDGPNIAYGDGDNGINLQDGNWHHLVAVVDRSQSTMTFYIDNNSFTPSMHGDVTNVGNIDNSNSLEFGRYNPTNYYFDGIIDEVGFWNRSLTASEISELYAEGAGNQYPFVVDTCSCPGAGNDWEIDMSDYCNITSDCDLTTGTLSFTGSGETRINSTIYTTDLGDPKANGILYIQDSCTIWVN